MVENVFVGQIGPEGLKVVSATFLLAYFVCLKGSTCETKESVFHFTSKALFVLESSFNFSSIQMS